MNIRNLLLPFVHSISNAMTCIEKGNDRVFILTFHSIPPHQIESFSLLIKSLNDRFGFITPDQFTDYLSGVYEIVSTKLLLTFDDGFHSNYIVAQEVLSVLNIKAIFFLTTGFINCTNSLGMKKFVVNNLLCTAGHFETQAMNWGQIQELIIEGHEVGAHTESHPNLVKITSSEMLVKEIIQSKLTLEDKLDIQVKHFAYPFGNIASINDDILNRLYEVYRFIYSGIRGPNISKAPNRVLRREAISLENDLKYNIRVASGALSFYYFWDRRKLDKMTVTKFNQ